MPDALGFDHAIGVITPSGNLVVERVTIALLRDLPAVSPHFSRIAVHGARDPFPDSYDLEGMLAAARLLAHAAPGVILWNGSKGFAIGVEHDRDLVRRITEATGIPAVTSSLALVEALGRLGAGRVALVTPYTEAYQGRLRARLAEAGIDCVAESHLGLSDNLSYAAVPPARIMAQIREAVAAAPARPEAVLTWCTNYAGALAAAEAEAETGIPVLDATVLPIWQALGLLGVDMAPAAPRWGMLFAPG
jgi:maleate isomerase